MEPKVEITTSKLASANGRASASPSTSSISTPASAARTRAAANSSGVRSTPVTFAPASAAATAAFPLPQATSSTSSPGATWACATQLRPTGRMWWTIAS
jgi:hypothetical protein